MPFEDNWASDSGDGKCVCVCARERQVCCVDDDEVLEHPRVERQVKKEEEKNTVRGVT